MSYQPPMAAPDLAIEILSPDQNMARFLDKIQFYLLNGVRLVWVIDSAAQTVAVLSPNQEAVPFFLATRSTEETSFQAFKSPLTRSLLRWC